MRVLPQVSINFKYKDGSNVASSDLVKLGRDLATFDIIQEANGEI
jgi:hypothetical protein